MINENGQILTLVLDPEDLSSRSYYLVDSKDFSYQLVRGDDHSEYVSEITINASQDKPPSSTVPWTAATTRSICGPRMAP